MLKQKAMNWSVTTEDLKVMEILEVESKIEVFEKNTES